MLLLRHGYAYANGRAIALRGFTRRTLREKSGGHDGGKKSGRIEYRL